MTSGGTVLSVTLSLPGDSIASGFGRADLVFEGVEQAGGSFEARVFFNNPEADASTPKEAAEGYAGSFHVYGYGRWPPSGPSSGPPAAAPPGPRAPMTRYLTVTGALRAALVGGDAVTVTVVAVPSGPAPGGGADLSGSLDPGRISVRFDPTEFG